MKAEQKVLENESESTFFSPDASESKTIVEVEQEIIEQAVTLSDHMMKETETLINTIEKTIDSTEKVLDTIKEVENGENELGIEESVPSTIKHTEEVHLFATTTETIEKELNKVEALTQKAEHLLIQAAQEINNEPKISETEQVKMINEEPKMIIEKKKIEYSDKPKKKIKRDNGYDQGLSVLEYLGSLAMQNPDIL